MEAKSSQKLTIQQVQAALPKQVDPARLDLEEPCGLCSSKKATDGGFIGLLDCCGKTFHYGCILTESFRQNLCPDCGQRFTVLAKYDLTAKRKAWHYVTHCDPDPKVVRMECEVFPKQVEQERLQLDDVCNFCLMEKGEEEDLALLDRCRHSFHYSCLLEWMKQRVTCVHCTLSFTALAKYSHQGKRLQWHYADDLLRLLKNGGVTVPTAFGDCVVCRQQRYDNALVFCDGEGPDGGCDRPFHWFCGGLRQPPLPDQLCLCPRCVAKKLKGKAKLKPSSSDEEKQALLQSFRRGRQQAPGPAAPRMDGAAGDSAGAREGRASRPLSADPTQRVLAGGGGASRIQTDASGRPLSLLDTILGVQTAPSSSSLREPSPAGPRSPFVSQAAAARRIARRAGGASAATAGVGGMPVGDVETEELQAFMLDSDELGGPVDREAAEREAEERRREMQRDLELLRERLRRERQVKRETSGSGPQAGVGAAGLDTIPLGSSPQDTNGQGKKRKPLRAPHQLRDATLQGTTDRTLQLPSELATPQGAPAGRQVTPDAPTLPDVQVYSNAATSDDQMSGDGGQERPGRSRQQGGMHVKPAAELVDLLKETMRRHGGFQAARVARERESPESYRAMFRRTLRHMAETLTQTHQEDLLELGYEHRGAFWGQPEARSAAERFAQAHLDAAFPPVA